MSTVQVAAITDSEKALLIPLARDLRAALSYVSFYSIDSPFVMQAIQKLHRDLQKILSSRESVVLHDRSNRMHLNDLPVPELEEFQKLLQEKGFIGVQFRRDLTLPELTQWLRKTASPAVERKDPVEKEAAGQVILLPRDCRVVMEGSTEASVPEPGPAAEIPVSTGEPKVPVPARAVIPAEPAAPAPPPPVVQTVPNPGPITRQPDPVPSDSPVIAHEALLSFVAEAWQFSQMQKRSLEALPATSDMTRSFDRLFTRLLDKLEKTSPELKNISEWFKAPPGELLGNDVVASMYPLMEVALRSGWSSVLFDSTTEGLVNDCLAYWGANGKHDLVLKTVGILAKGLSGGETERQLALAHLMDARPWISNAEALQMVVDQLNQLLANETRPHLYQTGLLLAWDLVGPLLSTGKELPVLTLLATLHFHADEELDPFRDRSRIARYWLFEKSTPDLVRRLIDCAFKADRLKQFPLLGDMGASLMLEDYLKGTQTEKTRLLRIFTEMREPLRSVLSVRIAEASSEEEIRSLIPVLRVCGIDPALSMVLCSWISRGSRDLKTNLIGLIEEMRETAGGPALRLALFDDQEEIAAMAARVIGKIRFTAGLPVLLKAVKLRETRAPGSGLFLTSVCQALGDLGLPEALPFLQDIARKKAMLWGRSFPLPLRLEAIQAVARIDKPEAWHFLETLVEEKTPEIQATIEKIIHERSGYAQ